MLVTGQLRTIWLLKLQIKFILSIYYVLENTSSRENKIFIERQLKVIYEIIQMYIHFNDYTNLFLQNAFQ